MHILGLLNSAWTGPGSQTSFQQLVDLQPWTELWGTSAHAHRFPIPAFSCFMSWWPQDTHLLQEFCLKEQAGTVRASRLFPPPPFLCRSSNLLCHIFPRKHCSEEPATVTSVQGTTVSSWHVPTQQTVGVGGHFKCSNVPESIILQGGRSSYCKDQRLETLGVSSQPLQTSASKSSCWWRVQLWTEFKVQFRVQRSSSGCSCESS